MKNWYFFLFRYTKKKYNLISWIELKNFDGGSIYSVLCNMEIEFKIEYLTSRTAHQSNKLREKKKTKLILPMFRKWQNLFRRQKYAEQVLIACWVAVFEWFVAANLQFFEFDHTIAELFGKSFNSS